MYKLSFLIFTASLFFLTACEETENGVDAYGNFETTEVIVSSEANGKLLQFDVEEGMQLKVGKMVALIDSVQLHLKKLQLKAAIKTVGTKLQDSKPQIDVLKEQKRVLLREKKRVEELLRDEAATQKQLDDIVGQLDILDKQIAATSSTTKTVNRGISGEIEPLRAQIDQINDQLSRCYLYNPVDGVVVQKYAEAFEMTGAGKPLYKIAKLDEMILRAYVSGAQLSEARIGQEVWVYIDESEESMKEMKGTISWISDKAEFTPKIVQTKEERVSLVYAVKIKVKNDGSIKIGMPGEVAFAKREAEESEEK